MEVHLFLSNQNSICLLKNPDKLKNINRLYTHTMRQPIFGSELGDLIHDMGKKGNAHFKAAAEIYHELKRELERQFSTNNVICIN